MSLKEELQEYITEILGQSVEISAPPKPEMGDVALPCFQFAKVLKKSPVAIATELALKLQEAAPRNDIITKAEASGPYVNITLSSTFVADFVMGEDSLAAQAFEAKTEGETQTIVVDYSSPNIAKNLGIHHLRSTMIGNAICNMHEQQGNKVVRLNYLGDWGTQFGVLLAACDKYGQQFDEQVTVDDLVQLYVLYSKESKDNPEMQEAARKEFKALEEETRFDGMMYGTSHYLEGHSTHRLDKWKEFRKISLEEFKSIYKRLGVGPKGMIFQGESAFSEAADRIVTEALEKGVAIESEGAIVIPIGKDKSPCMLRKSDGATTYESRDIACAIAHYNKYEFDQKLYVVGHGQAHHFDQVFTALKLLGYEWADRCKHIPFGLLRFGESKFSSRTGNIVRLDDALDVAFKEVTEKVKENDFGISHEDTDLIGMAAVIFADLSAKRIKDSSFKWEDILRFEGNTGPYLQYTAVRCGSILKKAFKDVYKATQTDFELLATPEEKQIMLEIARWPEAIEFAVEQNEPSLISHYLLKLAKTTNHYLHKHKVLNPDNIDLQVVRCALISIIQEHIITGLKILGIRIPAAM